MKVFSKILDKAYLNGAVLFHPLCDKIKLTYLCFADDLIIFSDASSHSLRGIRVVL